MKKCVIVFSFLLVCARISAQEQEAQQLLLNVEKLAQLKQMLSDLKKGYEILVKGYNSIKNISEGNFNLHEAFLQGLLAVSPAVRNYHKVADIVSLQIGIVKSYKSAFNSFTGSGLFTPEELDYLAKVYSSLVKGSLKNLESLAMILTSGDLRMSDDERLTEIDRIWTDVRDKSSFLHHFNSKSKILALQRAKDKHDIGLLQKIYGINP